MLKKLWMDESGICYTTEVIVLMTIVCLGLIVGATALRDALTSELADLATAVSSLNQSYSFSGLIGRIRAAMINL